MKKNELNPWDDHIVPRKKLDEKRVAKSKLRNVQAEIGQLSRKRSDLNPYQVLTIYLKRSLQLTYIEPWFQAFLPPRLKGKLFISTVGKHYWVIGTARPEYRMAFTFYQKEIHNSLENHLNKISKKRWKIPGFKVAVMPENPYDKLYQQELDALMSIKSVPMKSKEEKAAFRKKRREEQVQKEEAEAKRRSAASRIIGSISEELDQYQNRIGRGDLLNIGSKE